MNNPEQDIHREKRNRKATMAEPIEYSAFAKLYIITATDENTADRAAVLGNGLASLLRGIATEGSLNRAAKDMHMAYSKAWTLVNHAEEHFGITLIERNGARGSNLTEEGALLLHAFDTVNAEVNEFAQRRVKEEIAKLRQ